MASRNCDVCGKSYEAQKSTSRFCSSKCRSEAHRSRTAPPALKSLEGRVFDDLSSVVASLREILEEDDLVDTLVESKLRRLGNMAQILDQQPGNAAILREYRQLEADLERSLPSASDEGFQQVMQSLFDAARRS